MANSNSLSEIQRLSALSDGIFAVAMTLLAYNVHLPASSAGLQLSRELARMSGEVAGLLLSFAIAAMFWLSHLRLFQLLQKVDFGFRLVNFALLLSIVLLPISNQPVDPLRPIAGSDVRAGRESRLDLADDLIVMGLRTRERTAGIASPFNSSGTARAGSLPILDFDLCSVLARDDLETDVRTPAMELRLRFTLGRPFGQTMVWWQCGCTAKMRQCRLL
jgi:hypothetical protein